MTSLIADGIIFPMILLVGLGWFIPQGLGKVMPEGVGPLFALAVIAFVVMTLIGAALFATMYGWRGAQLSAFSPVQGMLHFGILSLKSALLWLPVMIISVANLPRHWVEETW